MVTRNVCSNKVKGAIRNPPPHLISTQISDGIRLHGRGCFESKV